MVVLWWPSNGPLVALRWPSGGPHESGGPLVAPMSCAVVVLWWSSGGPAVALWWPSGDPLVAFWIEHIVLWWPCGGPLVTGSDLVRLGESG